MARTLAITSQRKNGIGHEILGFKRACTISASNAGKWPRIVREPRKLTEDRPIPGRKESLTLDQRGRCVGASAESENTRARIKTVKSPSSNITLWNAASLISVGFDNSAVRMRTRRMAARSYVESPGSPLVVLETAAHCQPPPSAL